MKYRTPIDNEDYLIQEILDNFDFQKCRLAMISLNWKWAFDNTSPSIERLKAVAVDRLKSAIEIAKKNRCPKSTFFCSSGGLKGSAWVNRFGHIEAIRLEFVLTDWDADGDF